MARPITLQKRKCKNCGAMFQPQTASQSNCNVKCSMARVRENIVQMVGKRGPNYEKWRQGMRAAAER